MPRRRLSVSCTWRVRAIAASGAVVLALSGCHRAIGPLVRPDSSAVALTGGLATSMVYLARTGDSVIAIDLGWWRHRGPITAALRDLDALPDQVTDVFLTHSHRDHIGAWRLFRRSRIHVAESEKPLLLGARSHDAWVPRWTEWAKPSVLAAPNDVDVRAFARDTTFVFDRDTLYAFVVPGHTAGSTVYLFRGVLFLGDAVTHTPWGGFGRARRGYSDDVRVAAANLDSLWPRLPGDAVRYLCTAHAHCAVFSDDFLRDVRR
jgi:glyoxylase-like metal-dependent hydrolase (beta-lactamase superfamily II)